MSPFRPTPTLAGVLAALILGALLLVILLPAGNKIKPGDVYLRAGIPDSAMVASILDVAPNAAGELLIAILAFERLVEIDHVSPCLEIAQAYAATTLTIPIPLFLENVDKDCFSYRLRFDVRESGELSSFELALIHPTDHINFLQPHE